MRATDLWQEGSKATISFELFPARSEKAAEKLLGVTEDLAGLRPAFVSVTFGAGGSTRQGSYELVKRLKQSLGLEVVAYFACYGLNPQEIEAVLDGYQGLGVESILLVRGDIPHGVEGFEAHPASLRHATDLVKYVRPRYPFCLGVAGYPEGHIEAESLEVDLRYLKLKVELGAEFIITNYCYDNRYFFDFVTRCRQAGIRVPILPGIMPIYSAKMLVNLAKICGATITQEIWDGMAALPEEDPQALEQFGVEFAVRQCRELLREGLPGLHFYTMDRSSSVTAILERLRSDNLL